MREPGSPLPVRVAFGPFVLNGVQGCLRRAGSIVPLRRKAWEVLYRLATHRGEVVSNAELLDGVWGRAAVYPQVLTNVIREVRVALGDTDDTPRFIHTVRGRGYLFAADGDRPISEPRADICVGRDAELRRLAELWQEARPDVRACASSRANRVSARRHWSRAGVPSATPRGSRGLE